MGKADFDKFLCSWIEYYNKVFDSDKTSYKNFIEKCLEEQGLEYRNGKLQYIDSPEQVGFEELGKLWQEQHDTPYRTDGLKVNEEKISPKFKIGDWIVYEMNNGKIMPPRRIINMSDRRYVMEYGNYECDFGNFEDIENNYRLWNVEDDAEDGDVLYEDSCIFIFNKWKNDDSAVVHCVVSDEGGFEDGCCLYFCKENTFPATQEQRDFLFTKMKEAGYEWDFNKKVLKRKNPFNVERLKEVAKPETPREKGVTEFEENVKSIINKYVGKSQFADDYEARISSKELLSVARKEILNNINQWAIDNLVYDFKNGDSFNNKRVSDIYRQGIEDVLKVLKNG